MRYAGASPIFADARHITPLLIAEFHHSYAAIAGHYAAIISTATAVTVSRYCYLPYSLLRCLSTLIADAARHLLRCRDMRDIRHIFYYAAANMAITP